MAFDTYESSREQSRPIEVYEFALGVDTYRYTSADGPVTLGLNTYEAIPIRRGPITSDKGQELMVTVPAGNEFAGKYKLSVPGQRATLTIIQIQADDPDVDQIVRFKGFVRAVKFPDEGEANIVVKSAETALARQIPRMSFSAQCNHLLYDQQCKVDPNLFKHTGEVTDVTGNTITVAGANGFADGHFNGGFVKPATIDDFRLVLTHVGNVLTLLMPFPDDIEGGNVDVFAGCNRIVDGDCKTKFDNVIEHGGFGWTPSDNPFDGGIV